MQFLELQYWEKLFFGLFHMTTGSLLLAAGIFTDGEWRWMAITGAAALFTACACALIIKTPTESIKLTTGRAMLAILIGLGGTGEIAARWPGLDNDAARLMGASGLMTLLGFTVGYALLLVINRKSGAIANSIFGRVWSKAKED